MIYTQQEKQRMEVLLEAFRDYVDRSPFFDIVYSEKAGFLRVCVGEGADQIYFPITGFADMLAMFIDDFLQDAEERNENCPDKIRSLLMPTLNAFGEDALAVMEQRLESISR